MKCKIRLKGGAGSGNHGHSGRPGKIGGSSEGGGTRSIKLEYSNGKVMKAPTGWFHERGQVFSKRSTKNGVRTDVIVKRDGVKWVRETSITLVDFGQHPYPPDTKIFSTAEEAFDI